MHCELFSQNDNKDVENVKNKLQDPDCSSIKRQAVTIEPHVHFKARFSVHVEFSEYKEPAVNVSSDTHG